MTGWARTVGLGWVLLVGACGGPTNATEHVQIATRERFELVSSMMGARCGSLDCHGQVGRSLRIYSQLGLRQDTREYPGLDAGAVSGGEVEYNYRAATALEPEILAAVVADGGQHPERLSLVRKARGAEAHKGGQAIPTGSASDRCLLSWLASNVDDGACTEAAIIVRPDAGFPP